MVTFTDIIVVDHVSRKFGGVVVVDNLSFNVQKGEIFCIIGPNGAGKTTSMSMIMTLLHPSTGRTLVNGFDVVKDGSRVRSCVGVVFQEIILDEELTVRQNLDIHARLYGVLDSSNRIMELLRIVNLEDKIDANVSTLSGGMKRRIELARGLLGNPQILFLDEPTLGLDPVAKRAFLDYLKKINSQGMTIVIATNDMLEAEYVGHRAIFINHGKHIALGTIEQLKKNTKRHSLEEAFIKLASHEVLE